MPSRSSRSPSETGEERRDGRHPGSTRRLAHNQREQRRARRINDKIMEMKTMMESHGRNVKKDKYSILMSAVAHMEVLFELLCEEAKKNGSEAKDLIEKRISTDTLHKEAVLENRANNTSGQAAFRTFMSARGTMDSILDTYYYKHLFMETEMAQALLTTEGTFLDANRQFCNLHDIAQPSRLVGTTIFSLLMPFEVQRFLSTLTSLSKGLSETKPDPGRGDSQQFAVLTVLCISGASVLRQTLESAPNDPSWSLRSQSAISAGLTSMKGPRMPAEDKGKGADTNSLISDKAKSMESKEDSSGPSDARPSASGAGTMSRDRASVSPATDPPSINGTRRSMERSPGKGPREAAKGPWRGPEENGKWPFPPTWRGPWPGMDARGFREGFGRKFPGDKPARPVGDDPMPNGMSQRKDDFPMPYPWSQPMPGAVDMARFGGKYPASGGEGGMPPSMPMPYPPYPGEMMPPVADMRYGMQPPSMDARRPGGPPGPSGPPAPPMWGPSWNGGPPGPWGSRPYPLYPSGGGPEYPGSSRGMDSAAKDKEANGTPKRQRVQ